MVRRLADELAQLRVQHPQIRQGRPSALRDFHDALIQSLGVAADDAGGASQGNRLARNTRRRTTIRITTLGRCEVKLGDSKLSLSTWSGQRPRNLLLYMVANRGQATRDELIEALWAEPTSNATSKLATALSRARNALGEPDAIIRDGQQYFLGEAVEVHEDASEFLALLPSSPSRSLLEKLITYGDYLPGYYEDWVLERRRRLEDQYLELVEVFLRLPVGSWDPATVACARTALRLDPLNSSANSALVRYYMETGRLDMARRHCRKYRQHAVEAGLGLAPSLENLIISP